MATIRIGDLPASTTLDPKAMSAIRGAGAPWVFGWIRPFAPASASASQHPVINFYQINNFAEQMINQFQTVSVINSGNAASIALQVDERSVNNAAPAA